MHIITDTERGEALRQWDQRIQHTCVGEVGVILPAGAVSAALSISAGIMMGELCTQQPGAAASHMYEGPILPWLLNMLIRTYMYVR